MKRAFDVPRIVVAGASSNVGKTTITAGLISALRQQGLAVQPFKCGPDYVDPSYHERAAGRPCRNLDTWMLSDAQLLDSFTRACQDADIAVVEGVMGLYDGSDWHDERGSTAQIAKLLSAPVLLVVDISGSARSAAAVVLGYQHFDPAVAIRGVVLNFAGSERHAQGCAEAIERATALPMMGWLPRDMQLQIPERHLGLVPGGEQVDSDALIAQMAVAVSARFDVAGVVGLARDAVGAAEPTGGGVGFGVHTGAPLPDLPMRAAYGGLAAADRGGTGVDQRSGGSAAPAMDADRSGGSAAPAMDADRSGGLAAPAMDADRSGGLAAPAMDADRSGGLAAPAMDADRSGGLAAPAMDADRSGGSAAPATDADRGGASAARVTDADRDNWSSTHVLNTGQSVSRPIIAVARDEAFCFYYPENLELLIEEGAAVEFFSPLRGERPDLGAAGVYLGGGYPELHGPALASNTGLWSALKDMHAADVPIYAECGGFMVLTEGLIDSEGHSWPMGGLLPGFARMSGKLAALGYRHATALRSNLLAEPGETLRGHEFRYSSWVRDTNVCDDSAAWQLKGTRGDVPNDAVGIARGNLLASYLHVHFGQGRELAKRFVRRLRRAG